MKKSRENKKSVKGPLDMENIADVASSSECTGLIPTGPVNNSEYESYIDLYSTAISDAKKNKDNE